MYTFGGTFIKKDLNLCLPLNYYAKIIVELRKTQKRDSTVLRCYAYNQTKYFAISISIIEQSFLFKCFETSSYMFCVWLLILFSYLTDDFSFYVTDDFNHLLLIPMDKKRECKQKAIVNDNS